MSDITKEEIQDVWGIKLWDDTGYYLSDLKVKQQVYHNRPTSSTVLFNSKYPKHTHNGMGFYWSGSCTANFSDNKNANCESEYNFGEGNVKYMADFIHWLHNDRIKYLQLSPHLIIPVGILDKITWEADENYTIDDGYNCSISFEWEQLEPEIIN